MSVGEKHPVFKIVFFTSKSYSLAVESTNASWFPLIIIVSSKLLSRKSRKSLISLLSVKREVEKSFSGLH